MSLIFVVRKESYHKYKGTPLAILSGIGGITAASTVSSTQRATLRGTSSMFARLSSDSTSAAELRGTSSIFARGRIDDEANVFGSATLAGTSTFTAAAVATVRAKAILRGTSETSSAGSVSEADRAVCNIIITVIPESDAETGDTISARLIVDGVSYPIRSATYREPRTAAGVSLTCILQDPANRDAVAAGESFRFDIYHGGAWRTMFDVGRRSGGGFSFAFVEARPNDELSISTIGPVSDRLTKSPLDDLILYNPVLETIAVEQFQPVYDTEGGPHFPEIVPYVGLKLFDIFDEILVGRCGFDSYETDLPNYPVRRANFDRTDTFLGGIAPLIGAFDPLIFVKNNVVWILDSTQKIPAGFPAPYPIGPDKYRDAQFNETVLNVDGYEVTYTDSGGFDYSTTREVIDDPDEYGEIGDSNYMIIDRKRTFKDFYRSSNPTVVVNSEKISETTTVRADVGGSLVQIRESIETVSLDSFGRYRSIVKTVDGLRPDIENPGAFVYGSMLTERTAFDYSPDLINYGRKYLSKVSKTIRGLIVSDETNLHLGQPFKMAFVDGNRSGNLEAGQTLYYGAIRTIVETNQMDRKGQFECGTHTTDFLTTPPSTTNETTDARAGDPSLNGRSGTPQQIIVFRAGAVRTSAKMAAISVGELPVRDAIALVRRRLANQVDRQGSVKLVGVNSDIDRGFLFGLFDRNGETTGAYIVEGRAISLNNLGMASQSTSNVLEVRRVQYDT